MGNRHDHNVESSRRARSRFCRFCLCRYLLWVLHIHQGYDANNGEERGGLPSALAGDTDTSANANANTNANTNAKYYANTCASAGSKRKQRLQQLPQVITLPARQRLQRHERLQRHTSANANTNANANANTNAEQRHTDPNPNPNPYTNTSSRNN